MRRRPVHCYLLGVIGECLRAVTIAGWQALSGEAHEDVGHSLGNLRDSVFPRG